MAFSPAFAGFDRGTPPPLDWMQTLFTHSDFFFVGGYLVHGPKKGAALKWQEPYADILKQGWGMVLFAVPYSQKATPAPDKKLSAEEATTMGSEFGQKVKQIAHQFDPDQAGCVVIIDNEDYFSNVSDLLDTVFIKYYNAIFEEMQTAGADGNPPVRPGFYSHIPMVEQMLSVSPDLFPWPEQGDPIPYPPYTISKSSSINYNISLNRKINKTKSVIIPTILPAQSKSGTTSIGLGTQFVINAFYPSGIWMPPQKQLLGSLVPKYDFDFDFCYVRDPRFPHANPRFDMKGAILVRGFYQKDGMHMAAERVDLGGATGIVSFEGDLLEPEAPLVADEKGNVFSINKSTHLVMANHQNDGLLANFKEIGSQNFRRIRSLVAIDFASTTETKSSASAQIKNEILVFFVNKQNQLMGRRMTPEAPNPWSNAVQIGNSTLVHAFGNLACTHTTTSIDVFFLNAQGYLCTTSPLLASSKSYPTQNILTIEPTDNNKPPLLLRGTAISAVTPSSRYQLVFGISRTLHLAMGVWEKGKGWSALQIQGADTDKLFAHSRLSAYAPKSQTDVYLGALSGKGVPVVYKLTLSGGIWTCAPRVEHDKMVKPLPTTYQDAAPGSTVTRADDYAFNPYGDVVLSENGRGVSMCVVGTDIASGAGAVLIKYVSWTKSEWMRVR